MEGQPQVILSDVGLIGQRERGGVKAKHICVSSWSHVTDNLIPEGDNLAPLH